MEKQGKDQVIIFRITHNFRFLIDSIRHKNNLSITELIELAIINLCEKNNNEFIKIEGIDFKELSELVKNKYYRTIQSLSKSELLSKKLLILRLQNDFRKLKQCKKGDIKNLKELLNEYKKIAFHYVDNTEVMQELNKIEEGLKNCIIIDKEDSIEIENVLNGDKSQITYKRKK